MKKVGWLSILLAALLATIASTAVVASSMWVVDLLQEASLVVTAIGAAIFTFLPSYVVFRAFLRDNADAKVKRSTAEEQARRQVERLEALRRIDLAINSNADLRYVMQVFLREVVTQLKVDAATLLVLDPESQLLEYRACQGFRSNAITTVKQAVGEGLAGKAAEERRVVHESDVSVADGVARAEFLEGEDFVSYFGIPLIARGQVNGVLEVLSRNSLSADANWLSYLEALAGQAAIAIENTSMLTELQRSHSEIRVAYDATLEGWVKALDLRDKETEGHTQRVTEMTVKLAKAMGADPSELVHIRRGALLHDVGKIGIPDEILLKPDKLTDEEWEVMKRHPVYAYEWLSPVHYLRPALDIPYAHHERWDGTGYPRGLKGEEIPLAARIFAVVDVWDALRSDRPYRSGWSFERVSSYLVENTGTHFDPAVVAVFLQVVDSENDRRQVA